jgi:hypothetical protein
VLEEAVGDAGEPFQCLVVVDRDRLLRAVAAGDDQGAVEVVQQQVV